MTGTERHLVTEAWAVLGAALAVILPDQDSPSLTEPLRRAHALLAAARQVGAEEVE